MAIMGRKKKAVARGWDAINKQRDEEDRKNKEESNQKDKDKVTPEEHAKRINLLREMGLVK
jgi:hypothetical protein